MCNTFRYLFRKNQVEPMGCRNACHIFESLGLKTQETLLGLYTDSKGKEKIVVACVVRLDVR